MSTSAKHFIRHYIEMVAAMFAGMIVLGIPGEGALRALGSSSAQLQSDAPALAFLGMALIMTIPMVALMRYRGHSWRPCWEMSASMLLPTFGVIGAMWTGAGDFMTLMMIEHAVMLPAMLIPMLLRYDEYAGCGHEHAEAIA